MKKILLIFIISITSLFAFEEITQENFRQKVSQNNTMVKFHASWCSNCKILQKNFEQVNLKELGVKLYKVNIENQMELAQEYNIRAIPTVIYLKDGKLLATEIGLKTPSEIKKSIQQTFN